MSNTKIIKTACRQRDDAQRRAAQYKRVAEHALKVEQDAIWDKYEAQRYGNKMSYKFIKERRKFIGASVVAALAIAFAVLK